MILRMSSNDSVSAIVLAAGEGTRMKSERAKVLHTVAGRPIIDYVVAAALDAQVKDVIVVVGHQREAVTAHLDRAFGERVRTVVQAEQRGTGHAVQCALPALPNEAQAALLLYGDTPLIRDEDLGRLMAARAEGDHPLGMLTCRLSDPMGYGRIIRDERGAIRGVREERDASEPERAIDEVNPGVYVARLNFLSVSLARLSPDNDQGELYLTDIVSMAARVGQVAAQSAPSWTLMGINDRAQLAQAEERMVRRIAKRWQKQGASIAAGARIEAGVEIGRDAVIEHGVVLRGRTRVGAGARIDVGCVLTDVEVAERAYVKPYSVCSESVIGPEAQIGPFAHLRPASHIEARARVGNFVETKKTRLREGAKANHLAYLGDGDVGPGANVGAGTIFCNYDGVQKHRSVLGQGAFIGSNSQLVAPVEIGAGAYVASGSTITADVPPDALAIGRARQVNKEGYAKALREKLAADAAQKK